MTSEDLRTFLHASPFKPFTIHLVDGRVLSVYHPDYCLLIPKSRTMAIVIDEDDEDRMNYINPTLITRIVFTTNGKSKRKKAG